MSTSAVGYIKDMLSFIHGGFLDARSGQTDEQLHFVPDGESHSVAWVLWHAARVEDLLVQGAWQGKQEIWREGNWAEKTGLPERGFGTGQSTEEASAVAIGDMDALLGVPGRRQPIDTRVSRLAQRRRPGARSQTG